MTRANRRSSPSATLEVPLEAGQFYKDVLRGLRASQKELPCKYFYDEHGSHLFDQICELNEYYLTRTELGILRENARAVSDRLGRDCLLIEFGSGSALKTQVLLDHLFEPAAYVPVDVAHSHLERSAHALARRYPGLEVLPVCADFTKRFEVPRCTRRARRRVIFFPGSTIGNFGPEDATDLLRGIATLGGKGIGLVIGVDLAKDARLLEPAYNDRRGVTAAFNLNLLARINRELGADFPLEGFRHHAFYDQSLGRIEMHLIANQAINVQIGDVSVAFDAGESIRTECSYKYRLEQFQDMATNAGLRVVDVWADDRGLFSVQYLEAR